VSGVRRIGCVVPDLFFSARIHATGKAAGVEVVDVKPEALLEWCRENKPDLVILDLHGAGDPMERARALKSDAATRDIPLVGFYSHVDEAVRRAALDAGIDRVMPRSAFTVRLPNLLAGASSE
jgi:CheY-like chemotaxis protein